MTFYLHSFWTIYSTTTYHLFALILGLMFRDDLVIEQEELPPVLGWFMGILPTYKDLMSLVPGLIPEQHYLIRTRYILRTYVCIIAKKNGYDYINYIGHEIKFNFALFKLVPILQQICRNDLDQNVLSALITCIILLSRNNSFSLFI